MFCGAPQRQQLSVSSTVALGVHNLQVATRICYFVFFNLVFTSLLNESFDQNSVAVFRHLLYLVPIERCQDAGQASDS